MKQKTKSKIKATLGGLIIIALIVGSGVLLEIPYLVIIKVIGTMIVVGGIAWAGGWLLVTGITEIKK